MLCAGLRGDVRRWVARGELSLYDTVTREETDRPAVDISCVSPWDE